MSANDKRNDHSRQERKASGVKSWNVNDVKNDGGLIFNHKYFMKMKRKGHSKGAGLINVQEECCRRICRW